MPPHHRLPPGFAAWLALGVILSSPAAAARLESESTDLPLRAPTVVLADPATQHGFERGQAWRDFEARHGRWSAAWNARTGTPHRAVGSPIVLSGGPRDSVSIDRALRALVASEPGVFGAGTVLETAAIFPAGAVWYARYRQTFQGVPVAFASWEFRVRDGRLVAFGADVQAIPADTPVRALLVPAAAREAARAGVPFDPLADHVEGGERLWLVPDGETAARYRLAYEAEVVTAEPPHRWLTYVDALDGRVLWRHDRVRHAIAGTVTGQIQLTLPSDPLTTLPFELESVSIGNATATTDANGAYSGTGGSHTRVSTALSGTHCAVSRPGSASASFSTTVSDPATVNVAWGPSNSLDSERDGYWHVNHIYDHVKALDPGFTMNDYAMPCRVEQTGDVCNSFWDGAGINFYAAGGGCPSMATLPDLIYHEYGHSVNDHVYKQAGDGVGMLNGALHEGMADVMAAFVTDDPVMFDGFYGPGTSARTLLNANRWPEDRSGDPHWTGLIIGGAFWNLRQSLGLATAEHLSHFAKYGTPDDPDDGVAMNDYFLETLVADDDDADLTNGTPHIAQIAAAFDAHGIGTNFGIAIAHTPQVDTAAPGPYPVTATVGYTGAVGALAAGSITLNYSINGGAWTPVAMGPTGNPNEYRASIPAVSGAIVRYYVSAADTYGGVTTAPHGAPAEHVNTFLTGAVSTVFANDMETDPGWTVGAPGDAATTGIWLRADPVGTNVSGIEVQPELDHTTDPGTQCFVTGNALPTDPVGTNDVDGGRTTLLTSVFSAAATPHPAIEFYRWYSNNGGADPGREFWRVDLSNDGGTSWTPVENTNLTDNSWRRVVFFISDYLPPTSQMRVRFVADDEGPSSLVEAAVDDFRLLSFPATTAVNDEPAASTLALAAPRPNPFQGLTAIRYTLSRAARVSLEIHDLAGRSVRVLDAGERAAGAHDLAWDGRDDAGRATPSGTYFVRLIVDGVSRSRTVVRLR